MKPSIVLLFGSPGSGKSTQAALLALNQGFIHFDSGRMIEQIVHDSDRMSDPEVMRERDSFDKGILCTPRWVLKTIGDEMTRFAKAGLSLAVSGSPRTIEEAFGENKGEGIIPLIESLFGRERIHIFLIETSEAASKERNHNRQVCRVCKQALLFDGEMRKYCPICGGELYVRSLDAPDIITKRFDEFRLRTEPILQALKDYSMKIQIISGDRPPYEVHKEIVSFLGGELK